MIVRAVIGVALCVAAVGVSGAQAERRPPLPAGEIVATRVVTTRSPLRFDLYVMSAGGSRVRLLARDAAEAAASHDGRRITFVRDGAIWVMNRDGSGQKRVTTPPARFYDAAPAWTPDARTLYFSRGTGFGGPDTASIFSTRADGSGLRRVTRASLNSGIHDEPACHEDPSVSPDGQTVVYTLVVSCAHGFGYLVAAVTRGGKARDQRFRFPSFDEAIGEIEYGRASWAPAGTRVAYDAWSCELLQQDAAAHGIYTSATGGSPPRRVISWISHREGEYCPGPTAERPAWSPDGDWLTFVKSVGIVRSGQYVAAARGDVWITPSTGGAARRLTTTADYTAQSWLPPRSG